MHVLAEKLPYFFRHRRWQSGAYQVGLPTPQDTLHVFCCLKHSALSGHVLVTLFLQCYLHGPWYCIRIASVHHFGDLPFCNVYKVDVKVQFDMTSVEM